MVRDGFLETAQELEHGKIKMVERSRGKQARRDRNRTLRSDLSVC